ncbi:hypothetical protein HPB47_025334 [Ixodes persulcatus]|uniref:Uncharacterized protein n=1 Tax=Ixodes persulcatus TaxID=34615 RepID=A0AC60Q2F3_IXOPE|nr:hypothetical protein HPB47_025334 [Ixodes persulcatus]
MKGQYSKHCLFSDSGNSEAYLVALHRVARALAQPTLVCCFADDPLLYHAFAIVVCLEKGTSFDGHDLVLWGRLGNSVHKTVVLASLVEDQVQYLSLCWSGDL